MRRTLLWTAICFVTGMAVAGTVSWQGIAFAVLLFGMLLISGMALFRRQDWPFIVGLILSFALGAAWYEQHEIGNTTHFPFAEGIEQSMRLHGMIVTHPVIDGDLVVFDLRSTAASWEAKTMDTFGEKVRVFLKLTTPAEIGIVKEWSRGEQMVLAGVLKAPMHATNFGAFDYRDYLYKQHIHWTLHVKGAGNVKTKPIEPWTIHQGLAHVDRLRDKLSARVDTLFSQPVSGFMKGLLLGVRDDLDPQSYDAFSQIGLTHILAISGLHVGLYVGAILWLLRRVPITREQRLMLTMIAVPIYVVFTGASPSVVRAGMMAVIALYLAKRHVLQDGLHVLACTAVLMLIWNPYYLYNVSFQLSFAVTAGIIRSVPWLTAMIPIQSRVVNTAIAVTLSAQLVSFPLTIYYFNGFSLLSFIANLVMVPLYSFVILPLGAIAIIVSYIFFPFADGLSSLVQWIVVFSFETVDLLNQIEGMFLIWATPPLWWIGAYYLVLFGILWANYERMKWKVLIRYVVLGSGFIIFAFILAYAYPLNWGERSSAVISFLDVGQGDAILIRSPSGQHLLIDGGGTLRFQKTEDQWKLRRDPYEVGKDVLVPLLKKRGVRTLDALFLSHQDTDHIGGLQAVIEEIPIRHVFFNGTVKPSDTASQFFRTAIAKQIPLSIIDSGSTLQIDSNTTIHIIQSGTQGRQVIALKEQNKASLVLLMSIFSRTFLFTGDISAKQEAQILSRVSSATITDGVPVDVMKIAHHGSKNSTSGAWIDAWKPGIGVISAGRNNVYGHPHPTITQRLMSQQIMTYRTDLHGEVQFRITPGQFQVRTKRPTTTDH